MSPNVNYRRGRRLEWERKKAWTELGWEVIRAAGSHGFADLVAFKSGRPVEAIQVKLVSTQAEAQRLLKAFKENPPLTPSKYFHLVLEIKIKGSNAIFSATV